VWVPLAKERSGARPRGLRGGMAARRRPVGPLLLRALAGAVKRERHRGAVLWRDGSAAPPVNLPRAGSEDCQQRWRCCLIFLAWFSCVETVVTHGMLIAYQEKNRPRKERKSKENFAHTMEGEVKEERFVEEAPHHAGTGGPARPPRQLVLRTAPASRRAIVLLGVPTTLPPPLLSSTSFFFFCSPRAQGEEATVEREVPLASLVGWGATNLGIDLNFGRTRPPPFLLLLHVALQLATVMKLTMVVGVCPV